METVGAKFLLSMPALKLKGRLTNREDIREVVIVMTCSGWPRQVLDLLSVVKYDL